MTTSLNECPICYEDIQATRNTCTTACGHTFCFQCMMKCLQTNNACPCCRAVLQETTEDDEETLGDEDEDEDDDEDDEYDDEDDAENTSVERISAALKEGGFTYQDLVAVFLQRYQSDDDETMYTEEFVSKKEEQLHSIVSDLDVETHNERYERDEMAEHDKAIMREIV